MFRSLRSASALLRRAGFREVHATEAIIDHQWTLGPFVQFALECEERRMLDSLEPSIRDRL